ncbi:hypothetical protein N7478_009068 [Penicillium angulare]|uniref:uncharacterized protein n=1 Tax=Penicillium angulare TaxID=116970 RepID=UPI002540A71C|nr:uncharacterized protein N7478_009068 [Penicillium angulare]KAJ5273943.1 hypothetical protein N7478_009068 [Penicillium angulare]
MRIAWNACGLNVQLDRLQQQISPSEQRLEATEAPGSHVNKLQDVINSISITSKTQSLLPAARLVEVLSDPALANHPTGDSLITSDKDASNYLWLAAAKAAVQTSGLAMNSLLDHTLQLQEEIYYWDEVLASKWLSGVYTAQTSPTRLWHWSVDVYTTHRAREASSATITRSVAAGWAQFYQIARQSLRECPNVRSWSLPIRSCRLEIRQKRDHLAAIRDLHTSSLGLLMEAWYAFQTEDFAVQTSASSQQWQTSVAKTVHLTEAILQHVVNQSSTAIFEQSVFQAVEVDTARVQSQSDSPLPTQQPKDLIQSLLRVLRDQIPTHTAAVYTSMDNHGRPSRLVRYWIPLSVALLSGSFSLNIISRRRDDIIQWVMNIGSTIMDFGSNWVVEPIHKLVGTIRHDEKSEIAIMSKNSLEAERASLERMVVDFVRDRPDSSKGNVADDTAAIISAVKEGDVTPVLKAYERDLRSPFVGTVRGDLIRALLIQIQKTKVDVEVAMSGIDALLKSQELVFGFIGLTPGILVSYTSLQWFAGLFSNRRGLRQGKKRFEFKRRLRHVTRILTSASLSSNGVISYKDSGRLICEAEALLQQAKTVLGGLQYREFREDIGDLLDIQGGVTKQLRVVERIRWTYFQ